MTLKMFSFLPNKPPPLPLDRPAFVARPTDRLAGENRHGLGEGAGIIKGGRQGRQDQGRWVVWGGGGRYV